MSDGLTPTQRAWLDSQHHREAFEDLSAADINRMDFATYARLTGRTLTVTPEPTAPPQAVAEAQHPAHSVEHPGIDFAQLSMSEYKRVREHLGIGRSPSARGIFGN
jgi:hypothetical protein